MNQTDKPINTSVAVKCNGCGASAFFVPGTHHLVCDYCGSEIKLSEPGLTDIVSYDYKTFIENLQTQAQYQWESTSVKCQNCGATTVLPANITSDICPFCATPLLTEMSVASSVLQPHYLLPFIVGAEEAADNFQNWLDSLWFAPSGLKRQVKNSASASLRGVYLPYWSYDADTATYYTGQRGDYYYETETYEEGGVQKTRSVRHTRWTDVCGTTRINFNDMLVAASPTIDETTLRKLEPWDFSQLVPFDHRYFSGFVSESYQTDPIDGLNAAKELMEPVIKEDVRRAIAGNEQRIYNTETSYYNLALKYVMLPMWLSSYQYGNKTYQFVVNASTGEVTGQRPWSAVKISLLIFFILLLIGVIAFNS